MLFPIFFACIALCSCGVPASPAKYTATSVILHDIDGSHNGDDPPGMCESVMLASVNYVPEIFQALQKIGNERYQLRGSVSPRFIQDATQTFQPIAQKMMEDAVKLQGRSVGPEDQQWLDNLMKIIEKYAVNLLGQMQTSNTGTVGLPGRVNTAPVLIPGGHGLNSWGGWGGYIPHTFGTYTIIPHTIPVLQQHNPTFAVRHTTGGCSESDDCDD